jgi:NAD-specific glutamate dehydrogenase
VRSGALVLDPARVAELRQGLESLRADAERLLTPQELEEGAARRLALEREGLPAGLAADVAAASLADRALNVLRVCQRSGAPVLDAGRVVARIGEGTGILWLHQRLREIDAGDPWDRMALADLRWELLELQRELAEAVLASRPADPVFAAETFLGRHAALLDHVRELEDQAGPSPSPAALLVIASRLRALRS